ncbi:MAG TPA: S8 family serine peptidase, partial [Actinomycetota bacterium]|nr:S8 family serine peptidase [Actinomycetota bacterium]
MRALLGAVTAVGLWAILPATAGAQPVEPTTTSPPVTTAPPTTAPPTTPAPPTTAAPPTPARTAVYVEDSGTSMAAPHVSGAVANFLSIRRE